MHYLCNLKLTLKVDVQVTKWKMSSINCQVKTQFTLVYRRLFICIDKITRGFYTYTYMHKIFWKDTQKTGNKDCIAGGGLSHIIEGQGGRTDFSVYSLLNCLNFIPYLYTC